MSSTSSLLSIVDDAMASARLAELPRTVAMEHAVAAVMATDKRLTAGTARRIVVSLLPAEASWSALLSRGVIADIMVDDPSLFRIISRAIEDARASGTDWIGQTQNAVAAVLAVRPDMTASQAMTLVNRVSIERANP